MSQGLQLLRKPTDRPLPCLELTNDVMTTSQKVNTTLLPLPTDLVDQYLQISVSGMVVLLWFQGNKCSVMECSIFQ
jgi:hypothetical protein